MRSCCAAVDVKPYLTTVHYGRRDVHSSVQPPCLVLQSYAMDHNNTIVLKTWVVEHDRSADCVWLKNRVTRHVEKLAREDAIELASALQTD